MFGFFSPRVKEGLEFDAKNLHVVFYKITQVQ